MTGTAAPPPREAPINTFSDTRLLDLAKGGQTDAFAEIYARYRDGIYHYCLRLLKSEDRACDAVQETFLRMQTGVGTLNDGLALRAWLYTIARNYSFNAMRGAKGIEPLDPEALSDTETPYEIYVRGEQAANLQALIDALKPGYREVILLKEFEGLSYAEIAEVTGSSESAVKSRLFKARQALIKALPSGWKERVNQ
jgi:RNA polymerase sigma-70 factor (ECF subfamily)